MAPGESAAYTWEEPTKAKKLSVRVGIGDWNEGKLSGQNAVVTGSTQRKSASAGSAVPYFSFNHIRNEEAGYFGTTKTVKLEEIGYIDNLPCPIQGDSGRGPSSQTKEKSLLCQVDTEGATRVLIVSDEVIGAQVTDKMIMRRHLASIRRKICEEEERRAKIDALKESLALLTSSADCGSQFHLDSDSTAIPSCNSECAGFPSDRVQHSFCGLMNSDAIEYELRELVDLDEGELLCFLDC